jgi:hypothetical protein
MFPWPASLRRDRHPLADSSVIAGSRLYEVLRRVLKLASECGKKLLALKLQATRNPVLADVRILAEQKVCSNMLSQYANPQLFLVETERRTKPGSAAVPPFVRARQQQRPVEHFWRCDACAA